MPESNPKVEQRIEAFPVPGRVAANHPQHVWLDRLAGRNKVEHFYSPLSYFCLPYRLRVIVTPAVYPRLFEFLHVNIQSTGQKSHCVNILWDHHNAMF